MIGEPDGAPDTADVAERARPTVRALPTAPHSVVWSRGHLYVLEPSLSGWRWVGIDDFGRPRALTSTELTRRGWSPQHGGVGR